MSAARAPSLLALGLGLGLALGGCSVSLTAPRAWRCQVDGDCAGGWQCAGDGYCHDPALGVGLPCRTDVDCTGGWMCAGDGTCHDPAVGVAVSCERAPCPGGWRCTKDRLCRDPAVGVTLPCSADGDCTGGWRCAGDGLCRDPAVGLTLSCGADSDCTGGWRCTLDHLCRNPDAGVTLPCLAQADCTGGWLCTRDQLCRNPAVGVAVACEAAGECPGGWRCALDHLCHDPDAGATVPCFSGADCLGGWRCTNDLVCRDPALGAPLPCVATADCTGGWFCGKDLVCHDPLRPLPLPCSRDDQCTVGWRCSTEGECVDAAPERGLPAGTFLRVDDLQGRRSPTVLATGRRLLLSKGAALTPQTDAGGVDVSELALLAWPGGAVEFTQVRAVDGVGANRDVTWNVLPQQFDAGVRGALVLGAQALVLTDAPAKSGGVTAVVLELDGGARVLGSALGTPTALHAVALGDGGFPAAAAVLSELGPQVLEVQSDIAEAVFSDLGPELVDFDVTRVFDGTAGPGDDTSKAGYTALGVGPSKVPGSCGTLFLRSAGTTVTKAREIPPLTYLVHGATVTAAAPTTCRSLSVRQVRGESYVVQEVDGERVVLNPQVCFATMCPLLLTSVSYGLACPLRGEELRDFLPGPAGAMQLLCASPGNRLSAYDVTPTGYSLLWQREAPALLDRTGDTLGFVSGRGGLSWQVGALGAPFSAGLDEPPLALAASGAAFDAIGASGRFSGAAGGTWRRVSASTGAPASWQGYLAGPAPGLVQGDGVVVELATGQLRYVPLTAPSSRGLSLAAPISIAGRAGVAVCQGDALATADAPDGGYGLLRAQVRPVPGFEVASAALGPQDAGVLDAYLVSAGRLFHLSGRALDRWLVRELSLSGRDAVATWFSGARARVGTAEGEVIALPERVPLSPPLTSGQARGLAGACGLSFALDDDGLWRLEPADGGLGAWRALDAGAGVSLVGGRFLSADGRLFVGLPSGEVREVVSGGCP